MVNIDKVNVEINSEVMEKLKEISYILNNEFHTKEYFELIKQMKDKDDKNEFPKYLFVGLTVAHALRSDKNFNEEKKDNIILGRIHGLYVILVPKNHDLLKVVSEQEIDLMKQIIDYEEKVNKE